MAVGTHRREPRTRLIVRLMKKPFRSVADAPESVLPNKKEAPEPTPPETGLVWGQRPNMPDEFLARVNGKYAGRVWKWGRAWYASVVSASDNRPLGLGTAFSQEQAQKAVERMLGFGGSDSVSDQV